MAGMASFRTTPHLLGLITLIGRLTQEGVNVSLQELDLTFTQAVALVRLWRTEDGTLQQTDMIESLAVSRAFGSQLLAGLEGRNLVQRRAHPADARRQVVHLTEEGRELEGAVLGVFDRAEEALLDGLTVEQCRIAGELLSVMLANAQARQSDVP